jgi:hypothetical protein
MPTSPDSIKAQKFFDLLSSNLHAISNKYFYLMLTDRYALFPAAPVNFVTMRVADLGCQRLKNTA